jgi:hypothetical protein
MTQLTVLFLAAFATFMLQPTRPPVVQSVDLSVPFAPVTFKQDDVDQLVYELHVRNFQAVDVTLAAVRINGATGLVAEYREAELAKRITRPGLRRDHATPRLMGPGMTAVINIWIPVFGDKLPPPTVTHHVELDVHRAAGTVRTTVRGGTADVSFESAVTLDAPLRSGSWVAIYDPLLMGGHRTAIYTVDGRARIPGRFAIDFVKLRPSGALERDRAARRPDANGFGAEVLAVADGTIAAAVDDTPDGLPQPTAPEVASGNYIAIDLGGGRFTFYEHLQRGSVTVKSGQRVKRGHVIAHLGSSGSTSLGPHLHFHIADANSLLGAEGMPFVFRRFSVLGAYQSIASLQNGEKWLPGHFARTSTDARPTPNSVITFP